MAKGSLKIKKAKNNCCVFQAVLFEGVTCDGGGSAEEVAAEVLEHQALLYNGPIFVNSSFIQV